ncbi:MAG TPA: tetratricopeptide repeat protein [Pyrinomonadaceae bacterium]
MFLALALALFSAAASARAQGSSDDVFDDTDADPVKLFERGQNAHAKGDAENLKLALEFYDQAIRLRPEFPEAEFQRGAAFVALGETANAEKAFRRASELNSKWAMPPAALGSLLARQRRDREAEQPLRRALELEAGNRMALLALADVRMRAGDKKEALVLLRRATDDEHAKASDWTARGEAERETGDAAAAIKSFTRAINIDSDFVPARMLRAESLVATGEGERALSDLQFVREAAPSDWKTTLHVARIYARMGRKSEALQILDVMPDEFKKSDEVATFRTEMLTECDDTPATRASLEKLVERDPRNASVHACLGSLYRVSDPARSLQHYRTARELEPNNIDHATGFGAALLQARRFAEAVRVLRLVVHAAPENYTAHANLATALNESELYREALDEYKWLNRARPELALVLYLIARAHDKLGEYNEALVFYETFLTKADAQANRMEVERVNLRLPSLRNQIKLGEGKKKGGR